MTMRDLDDAVYAYAKSAEVIREIASDIETDWNHCPDNASRLLHSLAFMLRVHATLRNEVSTGLAICLPCSWAHSRKYPQIIRRILRAQRMTDDTMRQLAAFVSKQEALKGIEDYANTKGEQQ